MSGPWKVLARLFWFKAGMMGGGALLSEGTGAAILATTMCVMFAFAEAAERQAGTW